MSVQYAYYRPTTPPDAPLSAAHSRHASDSSVYSTDASSPWSATTSATSPGGSPPRKLHHGPALLPKIRPQDVVVEPAPMAGSQRQRRNTRNPPAPLPYVHGSSGAQRSAYLTSQAAPGYSTSNGVALLSPLSITSSNKRKASSSPEGHSRYASESRSREAMLERYGYPTYRQLPRYIVPSMPATPNIIVHPPYLQQRSTAEYTYQQQPAVVSKMPQYCHQHSYTQDVHPYPLGPVCHPEEVDESTTILAYLTAPTQAIKLVRNVNVVPIRGMHDYFWWDVRNLRNWNSFHPSTFDSIDCLTKLLTTEIPSYLTPSTMVHPSRLAPECETTLIGLINDIYAPRVNAALAVSQGPNHLRLYPAPGVRTSVNRNYGGPHFLANYSTDTYQTASGLPRGRLVGIVRSFDRWNTGMRKEAEPRRVEYLNGLAHLQRCMREHGCRYGFIMTEIELVCVRAGCDSGDSEAVPYFGFLEISSPIPTKTSDDDSRFHSPALSSAGTDGLSSSTSSTRSRSTSHSPNPDRTTHPYYTENANPQSLDGPLTTTLALYFLLMLSKDTPLPSQPSPHINVGGPGALTRQKVLPEGRDKWIPKVHAGETRDAKRVRGWVWPEDPWHRREGGGVSSRGRGRAVNDSNGEGDVRLKRWHK